jgi:indole-3-glycerol phosphate synthase
MILDDIIANTLQEVAGREREASVAEQERHAHSVAPPRTVSFDGVMSLIAEVKRRSPSAGDLGAILDPATVARTYESGGASAISVLTDNHYFGGSLDDLEAVRGAVSVPVLCKDFVVTTYQVFEARARGADMLLLIVAALRDAELIAFHDCTLNLGMTPLVEVHDQHELARALAIDARLIGINNRDLTDFSVDLVTTEYLAPLIPDNVTIVSESGITTRDDVERVARAGAQVVLVGEALVRASDPAAKIQELLG